MNDPLAEPGSAARDRWILIVLTAVLVGAGIGLRDPWPSDEPRFVLIAEHMLSSGEWLIPQRGTELYAHKPPLFFWIQATSIELFGVRMGFLLPALLSAILVMMLTHDLALRLYSRRTALWAGFALLALPQFVLIGRSGQIDPLLCLWVALGLYGIFRYLLVDRRADWLIAGFLAMGLGVITKGVGFLPLLVLPVYAYGRRRGWRNLAPAGGARTTLLWLAAAVAFLAPILIWALAIQWRVAESADPALAAYRDELFFQQTAGRYLGADYHPRPWWYLIVAVVPPFWLPLAMLLPYLAPRWWRRCKGGDARLILPLAWVLAVIAFFSFSGGKRGVYIAPAMPALALCAAPLLEAAFADRRVRTFFFAVALLIAAGALIAGSYLTAAPPARFAELIAPLDYNPFLILLAVGLAAVPAVLWFGRRRAGHGFLAVFAAAWLAYGLLAYPLLNDTRSGKHLMRLAEAGLEPGQDLGLVGWKEQMMLQAQVPVQGFGFSRSLPAQTESAIRWLAEDRRSRQVLLPAGVAPECVLPERGRELIYAHGRRWVLIDADAVAAACLESGRGHPSG